MAATLERKLTLWASISIVVGSVIGSSIFIKPAVMAQQLSSPALLLVVWVVAGIISLIGGMINAEIGTMLPETGGQYVYFRHMYGDFFAYLYGWASFIVINTASIAAIAFVFAQFSEYFVQMPHFARQIEEVAIHIPFIGNLFPLANAGVKTVAILMVIMITLINVKSVTSGAAVQVFFTSLKIIALLLMIGFLFSGKGHLQNLTRNPPSFNYSPWKLILGFIAASSGALASYDGWNNLGFVSGEIKNPQKNIPRSLIFGLGTCILLYVFATEAYLYIIPVDKMKSANLVAADAMNGAGVGLGSAFIAVLVMISTAGAINGNVLPCARVNFAMAREGYFFPFTGKVHPAYRTPANALWLQCGLTCVYILTGSFDMLADLFVFISWIFYGFGAYGLFILRRKMPREERKFKIWGYPLLPIIFLIFCALYFGLTIYNDIHNYITGAKPVINSLLGLLLTCLGIPLYWVFALASRNFRNGLKRKSSD